MTASPNVKKSSFVAVYEHGRCVSIGKDFIFAAHCHSPRAA
jgi:hypothetical protein